MTQLTRGTNDKTAILEGKLAFLRMNLALVMQELRETSGMTQVDLSKLLHVNQPAVAKLERVGDHKLGNVMRYLAAFDADLLVAVKQGHDVVQVSDDDEHVLVALPREVDNWAAEQDMDLEEFVLTAVQDHHDSVQHYELDMGRVLELPAPDYAPPEFQESAA